MDSATDPRWAVLSAAETSLITRFQQRGVLAIRFVAAFPDLPGVGVWLCTATDDERDALNDDSNHVEEILAELRHTGLSSIDLRNSSVAVQSQQTVDRDCQGSWFYALR